MFSRAQWLHRRPRSGWRSWQTCHRRPEKFRPRAEPLEARHLPSTIVDMGDLGNGSTTQAYDLNNVDQVVGAGHIPNVFYRGFLYQDGKVTVLYSYKNTYAWGINASGQVAGGHNITISSFRAFIYKDGNYVELGWLGGYVSGAKAINDAGMAVGYSTYPGG